MVFNGTDDRSQLWKFARGPLPAPEDLPVRVLEAPWKVIGIA